MLRLISNGLFPGVRVLVSVDISHEIVPECIFITGSVFLKVDFLNPYEIVVSALT